MSEVASDMDVSDRRCGVTALVCVSTCCAHSVYNCTASLCITCLTVISASISAAYNQIIMYYVYMVGFNFSQDQSLENFPNISPDLATPRYLSYINRNVNDTCITYLYLMQYSWTLIN